MLRTSFVSLAFALSTASAFGQQWAEKMFEVKSHDFGSVPRSAKTEFQFELTNLYRDDVHIASVRSSCGCTQPRILKDTLKSHEKGAIVAEFNTRSFSGQRSARVTVTIDRPQYAEVQLDVRGNIRTDIVLNPGQVAFGSVPEGTKLDKKIKVELTGRSDWRVSEATTDASYLTTSIKEASRSGGRVVYELAVHLNDDAPAGYLRDQILLTTNDGRNAQIPVNVEGLVVPQLSISPKILTLGTLQPGQKVTKQIVVKGIKPFKILDIKFDHEGFSAPVSDEAKAVQVVPITFVAGNDTGKISYKIEVITDLNDGRSAEVSANGQISPPLAGN